MVATQDELGAEVHRITGVEVMPKDLRWEERGLGGGTALVPDKVAEGLLRDAPTWEELVLSLPASEADGKGWCVLPLRAKVTLAEAGRAARRAGGAPTLLGRGKWGVRVLESTREDVRDALRLEGLLGGESADWPTYRIADVPRELGRAALVAGLAHSLGWQVRWLTKLGRPDADRSTVVVAAHAPPKTWVADVPGGSVVIRRELDAERPPAKDRATARGAEGERAADADGAKVCYTCGEAGHVARRCPVAPPREGGRTAGEMRQPVDPKAKRAGGADAPARRQRAPAVLLRRSPRRHHDPVVPTRTSGAGSRQAGGGGGRGKTRARDPGVEDTAPTPLPTDGGGAQEEAPKQAVKRAASQESQKTTGSVGQGRSGGMRRKKATASANAGQQQEAGRSSDDEELIAWESGDLVRIQGGRVGKLLMMEQEGDAVSWWVRLEQTGQAIQLEEGALQEY